MKSDLPNSSQFSPVQTDLTDLLGVVKASQPDRRKITQAIADKFFVGDLPKAKNTIYAMSEYGLVDKPTEDQSHASLTILGESLANKAARGLIDDLYTEFAQHILTQLHGLDLITCAGDLAIRGETITKAHIVKELRARGIYHPPNGTHANGMRQWLEQAGLVKDGGWIADPDRLKSLLGGVSVDELETYAGLTREQTAYAKAFARLNVEKAYSNKVATYATSLYGVEFPEGSLPQSVLFPLCEAKLITATKTTGGRGAKPYVIHPTDKLKNELIEPLLNALERSVGLKYRKLVRMRYQDVLRDLKDVNKHVKGLALEALAFYFARLLRLDFVQWRLRSSQTGGGELDVVMESSNLIFSRWQIQCKNTKEASLEDVAKEVGLAQVIKGNVIMVVTTGKVGPVARQFAEKVMRETNLYVALIDGNDLRTLRDAPADIADIMNKQAQGAMALKRDQVVS